MDRPSQTLEHVLSEAVPVPCHGCPVVGGTVTFDPEHRWYYVPEMTADEVLLLKCYDSKTDGRARFASHTAFTDPTTPPNAPPRESIELRALVFHDA